MYRDRPLLEVLSWIAAIASGVLTLYFSFGPSEKLSELISPRPTATHTAEPASRSSISLPEPGLHNQLSLAVAPSFECAKATYSTEKLICQSPELAVLDLTLSNAYRDAVASLTSKSDRTALRDQQNYWLRHIRERCTETTCLRNIYESRIAELRAVNRELPSNSIPPVILEGQ